MRNDNRAITKIAEFFDMFQWRVIEGSVDIVIILR